MQAQETQLFPVTDREQPACIEPKRGRFRELKRQLCGSFPGKSLHHLVDIRHASSSAGVACGALTAARLSLDLDPFNYHGFPVLVVILLNIFLGISEAVANQVIPWNFKSRWFMHIFELHGILSSPEVRILPELRRPADR
jgi:hypothetical protein